MKKVLISLLILTNATSIVALASTQDAIVTTNNISNAEEISNFSELNSEETHDFSNVEVDKENYIINLDLVDKKTRNITKFSYDAINEVLKIGDAVIKFETKVDFIHQDEKRPAEEILYDHKIETFNQMKNNIENKATPRFNVGNFVPSNAPYVVHLKFSKTIKELYGNLGTALGDVSAATTALTLCPGIPKSALIGMVSAVTGLSSWAISKTTGYVGGTWEYTQHRTAKQYQIGIIYDYAYRYAHRNITLKLEINGKTYSKSSGHSGTGSWWTSRKPW